MALALPSATDRTGMGKAAFLQALVVALGDAIGRGGRISEVLPREELAVRWQPRQSAWSDRAAHWCDSNRS